MTRKVKRIYNIYEVVDLNGEKYIVTKVMPLGAMELEPLEDFIQRNTYMDINGERLTVEEYIDKEYEKLLAGTRVNRFKFDK